MNCHVVFLGGESLPWLEIDEDRVSSRGTDFQVSDLPVMAIVPAAAVSYHPCALGGLSSAQAIAAARLDASEASLGANRHIAVAAAGDHYAIVDREQMRAWLAMLAGLDITPVALIPAPSLLPVQDEGFVRAVLHDETILRSAETGLAEDDVVAPLVVGDAPVRTLEPAELEQAIAGAVADPPLDLLQGEFAPRTDWSAPQGYWWRMAMLAAVLAALAILVPLAQWARLSMSTGSLNDKSAGIAARALGDASASDDAVDRLEDKLLAVRGGGAGFLATLGVVTAALEAQPNIELGPVAFEPDGTLRATVHAGGQPEIDVLRRAIEARGFSVSQGGQGTMQGRAEAELQVRPK